MELPLRTLLEDLGVMDDASAPEGLVLGIRLLVSEGEGLSGAHAYIARDADGAPRLLYADEQGREAYARAFPDMTLEKLFNAALSSWERLRAIERTLQDMRLKGEDLQGFVNYFSDLLGNPVYIVDASYKVLVIDDDPIYTEMSAIWKHLWQSRYLSYDIISMLRQKQEFNRLEQATDTMVVSSEVFPTEFINAPLMQNGVPAGHLFVVGYNRRITSGKVALADQCKRFIQDAFSGHFSSAFRRDRGYENFFLHLIDGNVHEPLIIQRQLKALGWDGDILYCAAATQDRAVDPLEAEGLCRSLEEIQAGKPLLTGEGTVVSIFAMHVRPEYQSIMSRLKSLGERRHVKFGLSDPFRSFADLGIHVQQAQFAAARSAGDGVRTYDSVAVEHLRAQTDPAVQRTFCDPGLAYLRSYDRRNNTLYYETLRCYLQHERNITDTAAALFIHRNTLLYRIERLRSLLSSDLDDPEVRLRLLLSYRFLDSAER